LIKSDKAILHPRSYLYQIAKNIAKDRVKSASFKLVDSIDDHEDILSSDEEDEVYLAAVSHEEFSQFCEAVRFLPLQCRRVFVLRKVYGFSQREVAKQLEIAESTVEKHVALGLRRCSERMTKSAVDDNNGHIKVGSDG
jgi:RNA polymerase sigma factor (sigma-70 family)